MQTVLLDCCVDYRPTFLMSAVPATSSVIEQLRVQLLRSQITHTNQTIVSTSFRRLDQLLPESGLPSGSVIEWVNDAPGLRTTTLALRCAARFLEKPGALAVVDAFNEFHAMSLVHLGIPTSRLLLVRPCQRSVTATNRSNSAGLSQAQRSDALWTLEQLARCSGVRIVMMQVDRLSSTAQRRLQLAVEKSGVTVFLIRPATALQQTSWADLQFHVQCTSQASQCIQGESAPASRSLISVQLVRSKNSVQRHGQVLLDCNHETGDVFEASELAGAAPVASKATRVG